MDDYKRLSEAMFISCSFINIYLIYILVFVLLKLDVCSLFKVKTYIQLRWSDFFMR